MLVASLERRVEAGLEQPHAHGQQRACSMAQRGTGSSCIRKPATAPVDAGAAHHTVSAGPACIEQPPAEGHHIGQTAIFMDQQPAFVAGVQDAQRQC